jgi:HAE1 family hydrophobic/amphiphilic exporter-1
LNLGIDFDRTVSTSSIFVHLECESGTALASVDEKILRYQRSIRRLPGIERIESQARRESGNLTVAFDPRAISRSALTAMLKRRAAEIPGAHIHIPRAYGEGELALRVTLTGDQISRLKEHAETAATALARCQEVSATVLHFKSNPPVLRFTPDLSAAAAHNLSPARIASHLQWTLQGPVAAKWITEGREMDIRLFGRCEAPQSKAGLRDLRIPRRNAPSMALMELGAITEEFPPSPIGRWNRKRAVSFSLLFPGLTAVEAAALVWAELDRLPLPTGYAYHIDKRVFELERECRLLGRLLLLAVLLIYMLLASRFESLLIPVPVLAILPTSLALPAIALGCAGRVVTVPTLIGFIILCGMAVNSSQLLVEEIRRYQRKGLQDWQAVRSAVRRRFSPLSLTTATTLLAILPLFFITHNPITAAMALVMFWGTLGAFFSTIIVLPPLCAHLPGLAPETEREAPGDIRHVSGKEPPS